MGSFGALFFWHAVYRAVPPEAFRRRAETGVSTAGNLLLLRIQQRERDIDGGTRRGTGCAAPVIACLALTMLLWYRPRS